MELHFSPEGNRPSLKRGHAYSMMNTLNEGTRGGGPRNLTLGENFVSFPGNFLPAVTGQEDRFGKQQWYHSHCFSSSTEQSWHVVPLPGIPSSLLPLTKSCSTKAFMDETIYGIYWNPEILGRWERMGTEERVKNQIGHMLTINEIWW